MAEGLPNRDPDLVRFLDCTPLERRGTRHWFSRSQNAVIEWVEAGADPAPFEVASDEEIMVSALTAGAAIQAPPRTPVPVRVHSSSSRPAASRSGSTARKLRRVRVGAQRRHRRIGHQLGDLRAAGCARRRDRRTLSPQAGGGPDSRHRTRRGRGAPGQPAAQDVSAATLSINWVEYAGPRDRTTLSPHSHADLEQCSLAAAGDFIHHLRVPWAKDANLCATTHT